MGAGMSEYCSHCGKPHDVWMAAPKYYDLTGETKDSIRNLRRKGAWLEGVHYQYDPMGRMWVNYTEAMKWIGASQRESGSENTGRAA